MEGLTKLEHLRNLNYQGNLIDQTEGIDTWIRESLSSLKILNNRQLQEATQKKKHRAISKPTKETTDQIPKTQNDSKKCQPNSNTKSQKQNELPKIAEQNQGPNSKKRLNETHETNQKKKQKTEPKYQIN